MALSFANFEVEGVGKFRSLEGEKSFLRSVKVCLDFGVVDVDERD